MAQLGLSSCDLCPAWDGRREGLVSERNKDLMSGSEDLSLTLVCVGLWRLSWLRSTAALVEGWRCGVVAALSDQLDRHLVSFIELLLASIPMHGSRAASTLIRSESDMTAIL